jgi:plastocyanin
VTVSQSLSLLRAERARTRFQAAELLSKLGVWLAMAALGTLGATAIAETHQVTITDNVYTPQNLTIAPGDTVVWTNAGSDHTVTAEDDSFHETLEFGHTFSRTFDIVGRYPYYCQLHGSPGSDMFGAIRVLLPGENVLPAKPVNASPANGATNVSLSPTLTSSAFSDVDVDDVHVASQWILRVSGEATSIFDSGEDAANRVSIELTGLENGVIYEWQVRHKDDRGGWSEYSAPTSFTTVAPVVGGGTGLQASYGVFNVRKQAVTKITAEQVNATIAFDWGVKKATKLTPANNFFIRWNGTVTPQFSERYRFRIRADGGVRLWINNILIVDDWVTWKFPIYRSGLADLQAGIPATIKLEYFDTTGAASCSLRWSSPSQPVEVIPQAKLSPPTEQ